MTQNIFRPTDPTIQLTKQGQLKHLLQIEGLSQDILQQIFERARSYIGPDHRIKYSPLKQPIAIVNMFFEASTRTRVSFELAAKKLASSAVNFDIAQSSTLKGETLLDTVKTIEAMQPDLFIIRHRENHAVNFLAQHVLPHTHIINAGDGSHAHPTQALLDTFTIQQHKTDISDLKIVIVGDIKHSRVARSLIQALKLLQAKHITAVCPDALAPEPIDGVEITNQLDSALAETDVIVMLRLQKERMQLSDIPNEQAYFNQYGLNKARLKLAKPDAIVMHPGPMNRGIEIATDVADGAQSCILQQITHGVAIRMAVMTTLLDNR